MAVADDHVVAVARESDGPALRHGLEQLLSQAEPPCARSDGIRAPKALDVLGRGNQQTVFPDGGSWLRWRRHLPGHEQPIRCIARVDGIRHWPVEVDEVFDGARPKAADVEPRIAAYERIEGPGDDVDSTRGRPVALVQLECSADVETACLGRDTGGM